MTRRSWYFVGAIAVLAYGVLCLVRSPLEIQRALAVPRMTCDDLLKNGPGPEGYVTLTDVRLCHRGFAFWRDAMSPDDVNAYIPVYSSVLPQEPPPADLAWVLEVRSGSEWQRIRNGDEFELTCQFHPGIGRLDDWARKDLTAKYPGLRLANLSILTIGLHEPTQAKAHRLFWHGILASPIGLAVLLWLLWPRSESETKQDSIPSE